MRRIGLGLAGALALLIATLLTLGGCATGTPSPGAGGAGAGGSAPGDGDGGADDGPVADPLDLVGIWRGTAEGEGPQPWLRLDAGSYQLWRDCAGFFEGGWEATGRAFVASAPFLANGGCGADLWPDLPWLTEVRSYRAVGDGWELLGVGGVLATLRADGAPEPIPTAAEHYARAPEISDTVRAAFAEPAELPAALSPAAASDLVGRWVPAGGARNDPHAALAADGTWTGSDGCNGAGGAWAVGEDGRVLAPSGISTLIGCEGAAVPSWLTGAARAGFDGTVLVMVDASGAELGRLVRG